MTAPAAVPQPSDPDARPYTQDDVDLVADTLVDARIQGLPIWRDGPARAVLDALAAAGRLVPPPAQ